MAEYGHHVYDRVYLIGVDGAGKFFTESETPNIDRIFADGAYNHGTVTSIPTISAQCWGSMLHGVSPQAHRLTNGIVGELPLADDFPYASVFKLAREAYPDAALSSMSNWNPINFGIIERGLGVIMGTGDDDEICEQVCRTITDDDPKLLFVQFDSVDGAGHHYGYGDENYLKRITYIDSLIGRIYDTAEKCGRLENTLFLVTADHGGSPDGHHGGNSDAEVIVSFFAKGVSVNKGEFGYMEIRDTASVVAFALGLEQPSNWSGRIPDGLFADGISFERASEISTDGTKRYSGRKNVPTPTEKGKALSDFVDTSRLRCYFPFDGDAVDAVGKCPSEVEGKIYFTEGFYGDAATLDDCTINCGAVNPGTVDYTICVWVKKPEGGEGEKWKIFSTMADEHDTGVAFYISGDKMIAELGLGDKMIHYERNLPENYQGNWFHFLTKYNRRSNELCYYYDFAIDSDWYSDILIPPELKLDGSKVCIGNNTPLSLDDLLVFDHNLSDAEIESLRRYYEQKWD